MPPGLGNTMSECLNRADGKCRGPVEFRARIDQDLLGDTRGLKAGFYRCDYHHEENVQRVQKLRARFPVHAPPDFSPLDAGEAWGEDDY